MSIVTIIFYLSFHVTPTHCHLTIFIPSLLSSSNGDRFSSDGGLQQQRSPSLLFSDGEVAMSNFLQRVRLERRSSQISIFLCHCSNLHPCLDKIVLHIFMSFLKEYRKAHESPLFCDATTNGFESKMADEQSNYIVLSEEILAFGIILSKLRPSPDRHSLHFHRTMFKDLHKHRAYSSVEEMLYALGITTQKPNRPRSILLTFYLTLFEQFQQRSNPTFLDYQLLISIIVLSK